MAVLSDGGLRRSEAAALTWGDVQRWDDGSGRITVVRSKTGVEVQGTVVAATLDTPPTVVEPPQILARLRIQSDARTHGLVHDHVFDQVRLQKRSPASIQRLENDVRVIAHFKVNDHQLEQVIHRTFQSVGPGLPFLRVFYEPVSNLCFEKFVGSYDV